MGREFVAVTDKGAERFAASMSMGRASLFNDIALLLERYVERPCGIRPASEDEHRIDPEIFMEFFEEFWNRGWIGEERGFVHGWAAYAAGMIENITLQPKTWVDRDGVELKVRRYLRMEELGSGGK